MAAINKYINFSIVELNNCLICELNDCASLFVPYSPLLHAYNIHIMRKHTDGQDKSSALKLYIYSGFSPGSY